MGILKKLEKRLTSADKDDSASLVLIQLVKSLCLNESFSLCLNESFSLSEIYELNYDDFQLALGIMKDWRLECHTKIGDRIFAIITGCKLDIAKPKKQGNSKNREAHQL